VQQIVFQEYSLAVREHTDQLRRLAHAFHGQVHTRRLRPVPEALHALRGVQCTVAVTAIAERGGLRRVDHPRPLMRDVGLPPSESSSGARRHQGAITQAGNTQARHALVEGAWAYRYPAKVSRHLQQRFETPPQGIQDLSWKAQVRLCQRYRRLSARGQHANQSASRSTMCKSCMIASKTPAFNQRSVC
jgi:transposase